MRISRSELRALLDLVNLTNEGELDCDEFLSRVAGYLERLFADRGTGEGAREDDRELLQHLEVCPECREEFDALCAALRGET